MLNLMEQFERFCRTKPHGEKYKYMDGGACAVAQFAKYIGMEDKYYGTSGKENMIISPEENYPFVEAEIYAATKPHTFGALANRIHDRVHDKGIFA